MRFFIDPDTDEPHIYLHGVEEEEVEDVLFSESFVITAYELGGRQLAAYRRRMRRRGR